MKNSKWQEIIRKRLVAYRKECLKCLNPDNDYSWGTDKANVQKTVDLMNNLLKGIPVQAWPALNGDDSSEYKIASNNWRMKLMWGDDKCRHADLKFSNDDHTAWVKEHSTDKGRFVNYDIGGS
jgi:hypothetical protein